MVTVEIVIEEQFTDVAGNIFNLTVEEIGVGFDGKMVYECKVESQTTEAVKFYSRLEMLPEDITAKKALASLLKEADRWWGLIAVMRKAIVDEHAKGEQANSISGFEKEFVL